MCDNNLPIAGSIKARGGIYEILKHAESIAIENNLIKKDTVYSIILTASINKFVSKYHVVVGST